MDVSQRDNLLIRRFAENYLRRDGLFIVRLISKNAGDLVAVEILCGLWENYGPKQRMMTEAIYKPSKKPQSNMKFHNKMEVVWQTAPSSDDACEPLPRVSLTSDPLDDVSCGANGGFCFDIWRALRGKVIEAKQIHISIVWNVTWLQTTAVHYRHCHWTPSLSRVYDFRNSALMCFSLRDQGIIIYAYFIQLCRLLMQSYIGPSPETTICNGYYQIKKPIVNIARRRCAISSYLHIDVAEWYVMVIIHD